MVASGSGKLFFAGYKATRNATSRINEYIEIRLSKKAANATINRELSALKRMLNIGAQQTPHIPMLREKNVRKGFFEHGDFIKLRGALSVRRGPETCGSKAIRLPRFSPRAQFGHNRQFQRKRGHPLKLITNCHNI